MLKFRLIGLFFLQSGFLLGSAQSPVCTDSFPASLLINPSFAQHSDCNHEWQGEGGLIDGSSSAVAITVPGWHPENTSQYIRYYSYDCKRSFGSIFDKDYTVLKTGFPGVPQPMVDTNGLISIEQYNIGYNGRLPEKQTNKKYITACLNTPLQAGVTYGFSFYLGFGLFNSNFNDITGFWASPSPFSVGIFGRTDCPAFPISRPADSSLGCLADRSGWISLGKTTIRGSRNWVEGYIEFTPTQTIYSIGIGPSCEDNSNIADTFALYYMDHFVLSTRDQFAYRSIRVLSGDPCNGNYVLQGPLYTGASYQWYKDEQLIPGATTAEYKVTNGVEAAGNYVAQVTLGDRCFHSLPFQAVFSPLYQFSLGTDTTVCDSTAYRLHATTVGVLSYLWQDGSSDSVYTATKNGSYRVTLTDPLGCTVTRSVKVQFVSCSTCRFYMPSAFTPNHDGINDLFRPLTYCTQLPLEQFHLILYNRWGQAVFESSNPAVGWDGTFKGMEAPVDVYVYVVEYAFFDSKPARLTGTVALIR